MMSPARDLPKFPNAIAHLTPELRLLRLAFLSGGTIALAKSEEVLRANNLDLAAIDGPISALSNAGLVQIQRPWWSRSGRNAILRLTSLGSDRASVLHARTSLSRELSVASVLHELNLARAKKLKDAKAKSKLAPVSFNELVGKMPAEFSAQDIKKAIDILFDRGVVRSEEIAGKNGTTPGLVVAGEAEALVSYIRARSG